MNGLARTIAAVGVIAVCVRPTFACRFVSRPFSESLAAASVVFTGQIAALNPVRGSGKAAVESVEMVFAVERWWKGGSAKSVKVLTDRSSCGLRANVGQKWLILGFGESETRTGLPSGSVLLRLEDGRSAGNAVPALVRQRLGRGRRPK